MFGRVTNLYSDMLRNSATCCAYKYDLRPELTVAEIHSFQRRLILDGRSNIFFEANRLFVNNSNVRADHPLYQLLLLKELM